MNDISRDILNPSFLAVITPMLLNP